MSSFLFSSSNLSKFPSHKLFKFMVSTSPHFQWLCRSPTAFHPIYIHLSYPSTLKAIFLLESQMAATAREEAGNLHSVSCPTIPIPQFHPCPVADNPTGLFFPLFFYSLDNSQSSWQIQLSSLLYILLAPRVLAHPNYFFHFSKQRNTDYAGSPAATYKGKHSLPGNSVTTQQKPKNVTPIQQRQDQTSTPRITIIWIPNANKQKYNQ